MKTYTVSKWKQTRGPAGPYLYDGEKFTKGDDEVTFSKPNIFIPTLEKSGRSNIYQDKNEKFRLTVKADGTYEFKHFGDGQGDPDDTETFTASAGGPDDTDRVRIPLLGLLRKIWRAWMRLFRR